jgi:O-antigen biosynthesis protein
MAISLTARDKYGIVVLVELPLQCISGAFSPLRLAIVGFDWDVPFQRFQQLAVALAHANRVTYWCGADSWFKTAARQICDRKLPRIPVVRRPRHNLVVVSLPKLVPGRLLLRHPQLDSIQTYLQSAWFADFPAIAPYDAAVLGNPTLSAILFWERIPARVKVYDCYDENAHFFPVGSEEHRRAVRAEARVVRRADLVFVSAQTLQERMNRAHSRVVMIPNGVDVTHFVGTEGGAGPDELAGVKGPILGFIGAVERWLDLALVARVADALPEYTIVMIGPVECDVSDLTKRPNVILTGRRTYDQLPAYVRRFDVCMIPFLDNELTRGVDPVKFYEYSAAGKPIVSTPLPSMRARSDIVYLATNSAEFARQVRRARDEDNSLRRAQRIQLARANSWQARADTVRNAIRAVLLEREVGDSKHQI